LPLYLFAILLVAAKGRAGKFVVPNFDSEFGNSRSAAARRRIVLQLGTCKLAACNYGRLVDIRRGTLDSGKLIRRFGA
jgi:hypothetical protein